MRKTQILAVAVMLLLAGTVVAQTVTVGTGTVAVNFPFYSGNGYQRSVDLYLAADIVTTGWITTLGFQHSSGVSQASNAFTIRLKATGDAVITDPTWAGLTTGATLVHTSTFNYTAAGPEWVTYTLDTPFNLASGQNLMVLIESTPGGTGTGGAENHYHTASDSRSRWAVNDETAPTELESETSTTNIQIGFGVVPVQLASFTVASVSNSVVLNWRTMSETNNYGFYVQSKGSADEAFADIPGAFIAGHGTTIEPQSYSWTIPSGDAKWFRLKQIDLDGSVHYSDQVNATLSAVEENVPVAFGLDQNYPNPFNPTTNIGYRVEGSGSVRLAVYDMLGREVAVLVNDTKAAGKYNVEFNAKGLASGVYTYRLQAGQQVESKRLVVVK
jgi:hypothetical protein